MVINESGKSSSLLGYKQTTEILVVRYGVSISKGDATQKDFLSEGKSNQKISHY